MMTRMVRGVFVLAFVATAWMVSATDTWVFAAGGDAEKGKPIFQSKCVSCHGPEGKGDGPVGKALKPPAGDFSSAASKKKSPEELQAIIEHGVPKTSMVAWKKQLSEAEIQDVLAYVLTLRK